MRVLIVEDEESLRGAIEARLTKEDIGVVGVGTGQEALDLLRSDEFDIVVTDLRLPDIAGIEIIRKAREFGVETPFLLMTAYASVRTAVNALKAGAADYLIKPMRVDDLVHRIKQLYDMTCLRRENSLLKRVMSRNPGAFWLPDTPAGEHISSLLSKVANTDMTVLIRGESGTGKGMMARFLREISNRAGQPLVAVNCGAIPDTLVESELFGHVKGAFTSADKAQDGLFMAANGGTLFLDEIVELTPAAQGKLLHVIEEKTVRPVGSTRGKTVDVRIIAATNRDLEEMLAEGTFRRDLYHRINIFPIELPPLRMQKEVLPSAVEFFLGKSSSQSKHSELTIDDAVLQKFQEYDWPGNLRELDNVIERAVLLCDDGHITLDVLPGSIINHEYRDPSGISDYGTFRDRVQAFERQVFNQAISDAGGDRKAAAYELGIGLSTLYRKLEESPSPD